MATRNSSRRTTTLRALIFVTALLTSSAAGAQNFPVTIDPGAYAGRFELFPSSGPGFGFVYGVQNLSLPAGQYYIETGASIGGSVFGFTVDGAGQVGNVTSGSGTSSGSTLHFNNVTITLNPGAYAGTWYLTTQDHVPHTGTEAVVLIPGLDYALDDGGFIGGPAGSTGFVFHVDGAGVVSTTSPGAATGGPNLLTLNNLLITINPTTYSGAYHVTGGFTFTGQTSVVVIPTLFIAVYIVGELPDYIIATSSGISPSGMLAVSNGITSFTFLVSVGTPGAAADALIQSLVSAGSVAAAQGGSLQASLAAAIAQIGVSNKTAKNILNAMLNKVDAFTKSGKITPAAHDQLVAAINALIASIP